MVRRQQLEGTLSGPQKLKRWARGADTEPLPPPSPHGSGHLRFDQMSAAYGWSLPPAVSQLSLDVPGGSSVVFVGHSGSGKSTTVLALCGLVPIVSGGLTIDGVDAGAMPLAKLRRGMAVVPQEPALFKGAGSVGGAWGWGCCCPAAALPTPPCSPPCPLHHPGRYVALQS